MKWFDRTALRVDLSTPESAPCPGMYGSIETHELALEVTEVVAVYRITCYFLPLVQWVVDAGPVRAEEEEGGDRGRGMEEERASSKRI